MNEARLIAGAIRRAVDEGWPVRDETTQLERPATFGDVAILFPTRTGLDEFEAALRGQEIPYRVEGGRGFFARQEILDLSSLLAAIDDPADSVSLVAALRSSVFACTDEEIYLHVVRHRPARLPLRHRGQPRVDRAGVRAAARPAPLPRAHLARASRARGGATHAPDRGRAHRLGRPAGGRERREAGRAGPRVLGGWRRRPARVRALARRSARLARHRGRRRRRGERRRGAARDDARLEGPRVPDRRAREPRLDRPAGRVEPVADRARRRLELRVDARAASSSRRPASRRRGRPRRRSSTPRSCGCSTSPRRGPATG